MDVASLYNIEQGVILIGILIQFLSKFVESLRFLFFVLILLHYRGYVSYTFQLSFISVQRIKQPRHHCVYFIQKIRSLTTAISIIYAMMERVFEQLQFGMSISFHFIARYLIFHNRIYSKSMENL